ncbi:MAG TPA: ABC transporter permease subunit [Clostridiales bacterium]|nr:ABC transporter permease subunit [Clostridiales bacterium]
MEGAVVSKRKVVKMKKNRCIFKKERDIPIYALLFPALFLVIIFNYIPMYGIIIAFKNFSPYKGIMGSEWKGIENFKYFLLDNNFWRVMRNTVVINFYKIIFGFPMPIIFALSLNELIRVKIKKLIQTLSYLPYFISWVVAAGIFIQILSPTGGIINLLMNRFLGIEPIYFLTKKEYFVSIVIISSIWKDFGMGSVYYLATLSTIDPTLYEAAKIDGAGRWKQTVHITLPGIKYIAIVLFIINIGSMVTIGFEQIFLLYNPLVYDVGDVISTYTYRLGIEQTRFSLTTAIGFTQSIVNFVLVYSANKISKKVAGWALW